MRLGAVPGATGTQTDSRKVESTIPRKRKSSPSDERRKEARQRRGLEQAVQDRHDLRNERNPLARRHLPKDQVHIDPELLPAKDFTRGTRVAAVTVDVDAAYRIKRGAAR